jgi:hypothetical protein
VICVALVAREIMTRSQQLGLVILLFAFVVYVILRVQ